MAAALRCRLTQGSATHSKRKYFTPEQRFGSGCANSSSLQCRQLRAWHQRLSFSVHIRRVACQPVDAPADGRTSIVFKQHVLVLKGLQALRAVNVLLQSALLVLAASQEECREQGQRISGISDAAYFVQLVVQNSGRHLLLRGLHCTAAAFQSRQHSGKSSDAERAEQPTKDSELVGVANLTVLPIASDEFAAATGFPLGTRYALISNVAVKQSARRQGVALRIMRDYMNLISNSSGVGLPPKFMALFVYKTNSAALRLYQKLGFVLVEWQDPNWLRDAEKGRIGIPKRLLMTYILG